MPSVLNNVPYHNKMSRDSSKMTKSEPGATPMECDIPKDISNHNQNIDDDDPVVHEIPVFLAKSLAKQLFLYQVRNKNISVDARGKNIPFTFLNEFKY